MTQTLTLGPGPSPQPLGRTLWELLLRGQGHLAGELQQVVQGLWLHLLSGLPWRTQGTEGVKSQSPKLTLCLSIISSCPGGWGGGVEFSSRWTGHHEGPGEGTGSRVGRRPTHRIEDTPGKVCGVGPPRPPLWVPSSPPRPAGPGGLPLPSSRQSQLSQFLRAQNPHPRLSRGPACVWAGRRH